jgi:hypothetical protein
MDKDVIEGGGEEEGRGVFFLEEDNDNTKCQKIDRANKSPSTPSLNLAMEVHDVEPDAIAKPTIAEPVDEIEPVEPAVDEIEPATTKPAIAKPALAKEPMDEKVEPVIVKPAIAKLVNEISQPAIANPMDEIVEPAIAKPMDKIAKPAIVVEPAIEIVEPATKRTMPKRKCSLVRAQQEVATKNRAVPIESANMLSVLPPMITWLLMLMATKLWSIPNG